MRRTSTNRNAWNLKLALLSFALLSLFQLPALGQQLYLRDFVLYGDQSTQIGTSTTISGGRIGSAQLVRTIGNTDITATINSTRLVQLANSNTVKGNITAEGMGSNGGTVFSTGSNFSFPNNNGQIHVGGNVVIQSGTIRGKLFMPASASYSGPTPIDRSDNPSFPLMPVLPPVSAFDAPGITNITGTGPIQPNTSYGDLVLNGGQTVTFSGPGVYTFKSIKISGNSNRFVLDFKNKTKEFIVINVHGDADLDKLNVQLLNGGDAGRVYTEVHGTGATSPNGTEAWRIANGSSGSSQGIWYGAVWAPNGGIFVGQGSSPSKIQGALWSGTQVSLGSGVSVTYVAPTPCTAPVALAGDDKTIECPATEATIGSTASSGATYRWTTVIDGVETVVGTQKIIKVTKGGTYKLTVRSVCGTTAVDEVVVTYISCIDPINTNSEKTNELIGHQLTFLKTNIEEAKKHLFLLGENNEFVLIEAVAVVGKEEEAKAFLIGLGMTDLIPNGLAYQVISGKFPVDKLPIINTRPDLINHGRPVFQPQANVGLTTSEGDKAIAANLARGGFSVGGAGVKIGVISDSYNRNEIPVDKALQDVLNGDLPGVGNKEGNTTPVHVVSEYPYGQRTDEGRAMLQIVHDLAPKAELAFATGFLSAGHMAQSILDLKNAGCNVIVDDVTYITEPFFQDGIISRTVNQVNQQGVAYFTSAGNFGQRAYTSTFRRAPAPPNSGRFAHDFGNGDIYQRLKLKAGTYTIVLQWQDNIYSLAQTTGTINDLDIYLLDPGGRIGFNRNNLGGDPFEVLSFTLNLADTSQVVDVDLLITKDDNSADNPLFKYIVFRGNAVIDEYYSGQPLVNKSTIVGHANAEGSIAVAAVLFSNTEPYGRTPSTASFSSSGGTPVFTPGAPPVVRRKPEIVAPNGVNTSPTVTMGPDIDFVTDPVNGTSDGFPNFYGTSASAPHAAAAAALVIEARKKFYQQNLSTNDLRYYLFETARPMQEDGIVGNWNYKAGYGLIQPDAAIRAFANPTPKIDQLVYNAAIIPGTEPFTLQIKGEYLSDNSVIYFRDAPIPTQRIDENTLQATIPVFGAENPPLNVYTPSFPGATGDGGLSNTLYFFSAARLKVTIKADNKTMKYGETLPANSFTVFVEGDSLHVYNQKFEKNLTLADLGLTNVQLSYADPGINPLTNVGSHRIDAIRNFDPAVPADRSLLVLYEYSFSPGFLQINKMPVAVSPKNFTVEYGEALTNFQYNYVFDPTANIANVQTLTNAIKAAHDAHVDKTVLGILNSVNGGAAVLFDNQILPVYNNAAIIYENKLYPVLSGTNGSAVVIIAGVQHPVENSLRSGGAVVILQGEEYPVINRGGAVVILQGEILPVISRSGGAVVILQGVEYPVENRSGGAVVIFNGEEHPVINSGGGAVVIFNGQYLPVISRSGGAVVILQGEEYPVINRSGGAVVILQGQEYPVVNSIRTAVTILNGKLYEVAVNATGGAEVILNGQTVAQNVPYLNGAGGGGGAAVIFNGEYLPVINRSGGAVVILQGEAYPVISRSGGAVVILQGQEYPVVNVSGAVVIFNGQYLPVINRSGGAVVILQGAEYPVVNRSGGAVVILQGQEYNVVNSISATTLQNMSTSATLNAIANAREIGAQPNKFIDVAANAFAQFNTNSSSSTLLNSLATVNARTLISANRLANGETVLVNTRTTAVTILNGSGAFVNSATLNSNSAQKTPVVVDEDDVDDNSIATIAMKGINMITGISSGEQYLIPATLFSPNFEITYGVGTVTIQKAPLTLKANDLTKNFGDVVSLNPAGFTVTAGITKYQERVSLASINSAGTAASAAPGTYPIFINNAIGSYGTDMNNYRPLYTNGVLRVLPSDCPILVHSRNNSFVNTAAAPVSLWLSVQVKVRGHLAKAGDSLVLRAGRLVLENVAYENSPVPIEVKRGVIIATAGITAPVSFYNSERDVFITKVPVGFSSTADVFITGAIVNSATGFIKSKNAGSVLSGIFQSNVDYSGQWNYSMAAYSALPGPVYVQYSQLSAEGSVVAVSAGYKAGTPIPWISRITSGGSGNGGTNYTGSPSNYDNFTACKVTTNPAVSTQQWLVSADRYGKDEEKIVASEKDLLVFPNPAGAFVTVSFIPPASGNATLRIFNAAGAQVKALYQGMAEKNKLYTRKVDTHQWAKGIYLVQLAVNNQTITRKLVISP